MSLLDSLLDAIVRLGGDALVMHVGERPYVVTNSRSLDDFRGPLSWGQVELSSRPLTPEAVLSMLGQMLPPDVRHTLDEVGAIEHEIDSPDGQHRFVVVAAQGGDDVWVEVRKKVAPAPVVEPAPMPEPVAEAPPADVVLAAAAEATDQPVPIVYETPAQEESPDEHEITLTFDPPAATADAHDHDEPLEIHAGDLPEGEWFSIPQTPVGQGFSPATSEMPVGQDFSPATSEIPVGQDFSPATPEIPVGQGFSPATPETPVGQDFSPATPEAPPEPAPEPVAELEPEPVAELEPEPVAELEPEPVAELEPEPVAEAEPDPAPVMRLQPRDPAPAHASTSAVEDILRDGLERGASTVYAIGGSRPLMRIEGEITSSASLPVLQPSDIDRFAFEFAPRGEVAHSTSEWTTHVPGAGRVRCVSFEDASGRGLVFHLAANVATADELGLSREIQALCSEPDGLVVVAGARASGKSTLLDAFVDRINRSRADHIITIESRVRTLHERRHSLISQREVDGDGMAIARAARAALREGPDVLVIDDARAPETIAVAIDAARAGRLVFASLPAPSTAAAIARLTEAFAVDRRPQVRALLSGALRAVISQVLVAKAGGGRVAAREVLLSSPPVVQLILDGAHGQVPVAIESGRRLGMRTLTDSLVALVRGGTIEAADALRAAPDRRALAAALRQEGIDVSDLERRA